MESCRFDRLVRGLASRRPRRAALPLLVALGLGLAGPREAAAKNTPQKKVRVCTCASADGATCQSQKKAKDKVKKLLRTNPCAYKGGCTGVSGCASSVPPLPPSPPSPPPPPGPPGCSPEPQAT